MSRAPHYDVRHAPGKGLPEGTELRDGVRVYPDSSVEAGCVTVVTTFQIPLERSVARQEMERWIHEVWPGVKIEWKLGRLNPRG